MKSLILLAILCTLSHARPGFGPGEQEWGYVTVREGAQMFWWLYLTEAPVQNYNERPLLIWLQGGPGSSSTGYGNFAELGPLDVDLNPRNYTWVKDANVLFIDNPVGTGFSHADSASAFTTTNRQIAEDLVELMRGFYEVMPTFKATKMYIISESYGGKMAAEFGLVLDEEIKAGNIDCNLQGVALGDSWVSPIDSVLTWAPFLLQMGAVDQAGHDQILASAIKTKEFLDAGEFIKATDQYEFTDLIIREVAHNVDIFNVLRKISSKNLNKSLVRDEDDDKIEIIMNKPGGVRETLGLQYPFGTQGNETYYRLTEDFMKPDTDIVELLLNSTDIKVFVYTGQLDLIVDTPGTVLWVDRLEWPGKSQWEKASRDPISVNGYYEGYQKEVGNLGLYWVNRAGHMVPADNPFAMDYILRKLTNDYDELK